MDCPRCGAPTPASPECPRCGVILAKAAGRRPPPSRGPSPRPSRGGHALPASEDEGARPGWRRVLLPALGLAVVVGLAVGLSRRSREPAASPASPPPATEADEPADDDALPPPPTFATPEPGPPVEVAEEALEASRAAAGDRQVAARLSERLRSGASLSGTDVRQAEDLFSRYPAAARDLLEAVLLGAAASHQKARRPDEAAELLERARVVAPRSPRALKVLLQLRAEAGDWTAAEAAARELVALGHGDAGVVRVLAYALVRLDRSREAAELLTAHLETNADPEARSLLDRILRDHAPEEALQEARLAHFHVRYDGEAHEDVGREILRLAERHYATLVRTFDHQPKDPIPVVLLSRASYYDAVGAPAWSGGQYTSFDGRVRIPIGGLSSALDSDLDGTLLHELAHAFVADLSRGVAPREIHEGLAQLVEGKKAETLAGPEGLRALADGRLPGVEGFYLSSLALVEDLVAQRGQGGINDLLLAMAETGRSDEAFLQVYGKDLAGLRRDTAVRLRQRYGS